MYTPPGILQLLCCGAQIFNYDKRLFVEVKDKCCELLYSPLQGPPSLQRSLYCLFNTQRYIIKLINKLKKGQYKLTRSFYYKLHCIFLKCSDQKQKNEAEWEYLSIFCEIRTKYYVFLEIKASAGKKW